MKKATIYDIARKYKEMRPEGHYFDRETLRFFGQKLRDFKVTKLATGKYMFEAPSYWEDMETRKPTLMGYSRGIVDMITGSFEFNVRYPDEEKRES